MTIRERTQEHEALLLSPLAMHAADSRGRERPEEPDALRTVFQRDRDRIIHCKAFRRLKYKTQVFLAPEGDHYRTRLTHTLEVSQIARTIARALCLNEDLTEAIALGHDLGHTPFGHAGERALAAIVPGGFRHYEQSVRVAQQLERDGEGLNLTFEVLDGMLNHTTGAQPQTLEGQVVRVSDRIAYINHDIDDACRAGVLRVEDIPAGLRAALGETHSARINTLITDLVRRSEGKPLLSMSAPVQEAFDAIHRFLFDAVYTNPVAKGEESKVGGIIEKLYEHFLKRADTLPDEFRRIAERESPSRAVCDFIAGMTDHYAIEAYETLFVPRAWKRM